MIFKKCQYLPSTLNMDCHCSKAFIWMNSFIPHYNHQRKVLLLHPLSVQFSSVAQSCPTLCDPMNRSTPGLPVHHQLPEFTQTHFHQVSDAIQPSCPRSSPSYPAFNLASIRVIFQMSQLFALGDHSVGVSASVSVLPMNIQD